METSDWKLRMEHYMRSYLGTQNYSLAIWGLVSWWHHVHYVEIFTKTSPLLGGARHVLTFKKWKKPISYWQVVMIATNQNLNLTNKCFPVISRGATKLLMTSLMVECYLSNYPQRKCSLMEEAWRQVWQTWVQILQLPLVLFSELLFLYL